LIQSNIWTLSRLHESVQAVGAPQRTIGVRTKRTIILGLKTLREHLKVAFSWANGNASSLSVCFLVIEGVEGILRKKKRSPAG
jgi:hypothetical protein